MTLHYIDAVAVANLERQMAGDTQSCARFMIDFASAWDARFSRLVSAVGRGDQPDAQAVLLSIITTSAMLGLNELAGEAEDVRASMGYMGPAQIDLGPLHGAGDRARAELNALAARYLAPAA